MKKNISLTGMMGVGKSFISEKLQEKLEGFSVVDTDFQIEAQAEKTISEIFEQDGEAIFREIEHRVINDVFKNENKIVSLGGGAFCFENNREIIKQNSFVVYLKASPETLLARLKSSVNRPLLKEDFGLAKIERILNEREGQYSLADYVVVTDGKTPEQIVDEIIKVINND